LGQIIWQAIISAEYFYRDVSNYVLNVTADKILFNPLTGLNSTYAYTSPFNAGSAQIKGAALTLQQDLPYGFGLQTNYTFSEANATTGYNMPYLSRHAYNAVAFYEKDKWSARVSYNWRSAAFTQIGRLSRPQFTDSFGELDASLGYQISKNFEVRVDGRNLSDATYYQYTQFKFVPAGEYKTGRLFLLTGTFKM